MTLPYSPSRQVGDWVFLAGQGGFDHDKGELVGDTIEEQTEQALRNVAALLQWHGASLADVVSCLVHLSDLSDYERFNAVYGQHFADPKPARTTVAAALVRGMLVEVTAVAHVSP
jgi:2-iminobutanoate/2-iminopropanoate deaminase